MNSKTLLNRLCELLLQKTTNQSTNYETCKALSEDVFYLTNNYISVSTVQRFFKNQEMGAYPSKFVLNSMCQYLGYIDWNDFVKHTTNTSKDENTV